MRGITQTKTIAGLLVLGLALAGCGSSEEGLIIEKYPADIVHMEGIGALRFGEERDELLEDDRVYNGELACGGLEPYDVPGIADLADIFFDNKGRFSVVWIFSPEITTSDELTVGVPIESVREQYPNAEELPGVGHSFPGVLASERNTGLLFLYDPHTGEVAKFLAGYVNSLRAVQHGAMDC